MKIPLSRKNRRLAERKAEIARQAARVAELEGALREVKRLTDAATDLPGMMRACDGASALASRALGEGG